MPKKLALKRLTASDLSLFTSYFREHDNVKQKAINMDAKVFIDALYPSLPEEVEVLPNRRVPLDLYISGPGLQGAHNLQRKILKQEKNWRLNGELINGPEDATDRYAELRPGDFAVFEFSGTTIPTSAKMVLIAQSNPADESLFAALQNEFPTGSMFALEGEALDIVISHSQVAVGHPITEISDRALTEDVALGDSRSAEVLTIRRAGRGISPEDFRAAKMFAEQIGAQGEELLNHYFEQQERDHTIASYEWSSRTNSISSFDFRLVPTDGVARVLDAKSTSGDFNRRIHLSYSEIATAATGNAPYDIYRLSCVTESSAVLRVARDIGHRLNTVMHSCDLFPAAIRVDSLSFDPDFFDFDAEEIHINVEEQHEETEAG